MTDFKGVPILYQYAITQQWDALIERTRSHPEETTWYEPTNRTTTLHILCQNITNAVSPPPFRAISILARAHAACKAPFQVKAGDWTPLHYACSRKANAEVIRLLVDGAKSVNVPLCALRDNAGCCALHISCRSGSTADVIKILTAEYPEAVWMRSEMGKVNPFESLWAAECNNLIINRYSNGMTDKLDYFETASNIGTNFIYYCVPLTIICMESRKLSQFYIPYARIVCVSHLGFSYLQSRSMDLIKQW